MSKSETLSDDTVSDQVLVELVQSAQIGDTAAFRELIRRYQGRVAANCRYLTRSPEDVDDLVQEVFVKAYFGIPRFRGESEFGTWIQRIKINHCLNFIKSSRRKAFINIEDVSEDAEAMVTQPIDETDLKTVERRVVIREILESLPEGLRVPLVLCDLDGLSYKEVAEATGISLTAARMRIKRGRDEFRRRYRRTLDRSEEVEVAPGGVG